MKNKNKKDSESRREFLKSSLVIGASSIGGIGALMSCSSEKENIDSGGTVKLLDTEGNLVEVAKSSLKKSDCSQHEDVRTGDPNKEYVMVIDLAKCRNARKCVEKCQKMHHLPSTDEWMKVFLMQDSEDTASYWFPKPCFHCDSPPCVNVCPVGATFKRQDGIVLIDNERCIGCKFCMTACPYSSRVFNWKEPVISEGVSEQDYSPETSIPQKIGTVGKCDFCPDMAEKGILPACITACPNGVLYYGDKNEDVVTNGEETLLFSELIYQRAGYRYMEELGTRPSVYYLPPVNRLFHPEQGFKNLDDEVKSRYVNARAKIKKERP